MISQYTTGVNDWSGTDAVRPDLPVGGATGVSVAATYTPYFNSGIKVRLAVLRKTSMCAEL